MTDPNSRLWSQTPDQRHDGRSHAGRLCRKRPAARNDKVDREDSIIEQTITLRPVRAEDRKEWVRLWTGYLTFYETALEQDVYDFTFSRLLSSEDWSPNGLVLADGSTLRLFRSVHYFCDAHRWKSGPICYPQDLFVDPERRQQGLGRRLIEGVYAEADRDGASGVCWMTQDFNTEARKLYDQSVDP